MGITVRHTERDKSSGRLSFRRVYPEALRPFIPKRPRELKVSLRSKNLREAAALQRYGAAQAEYDRVVATARLKAIGKTRPLAEGDIAFLTQTYAHRLRANLSDTHFDTDDSRRDWLIMSAWRYAPFGFMDAYSATEAGRETVWTNAERVREALPSLIAIWRSAIADGDSAKVIEIEAGTADELLAEHALEGACDHPLFVRLCLALLRADIASGEQLGGLVVDGNEIELVEAPSPLGGPAVSSSAAGPSEDAQTSFQAIAKALLANPRQSIGASTKQSSATALRFFREACGTPASAKITRATVSAWIDLTAQRPRTLPRSQAALPLHEVVELYVGRTDVPRLSPKTYNGYASALAALWNKAQKAGHIGEGRTNPFANQRVAINTAAATDSAKGFSKEELNAIFSLPIFTRGERPLRGKGDASYWIPLLLLWTGARPEEVAQLMLADFKSDDRLGPTMAFTDAGTHAHKGQRGLKTTRKNSGRRIIPIPQPLIDLGLMAYVADLRTRGETVLFPSLRTRGARGLLFAGWGEWWSKLLREQGILSAAAYQRQPSREFRHTWTTAARASGIPREAREYIQGHKAAGGTANEDYGTQAPLGELIGRLEFEGADLSMIAKWQES